MKAVDSTIKIIVALLSLHVEMAWSLTEREQLLESAVRQMPAVQPRPELKSKDAKPIIGMGKSRASERRSSTSGGNTVKNGVETEVGTLAVTTNNLVRGNVDARNASRILIGNTQIGGKGSEANIGRVFGAPSGVWLNRPESGSGSKINDDRLKPSPRNGRTNTQGDGDSKSNLNGLATKEQIQKALDMARLADCSYEEPCEQIPEGWEKIQPEAIGLNLSLWDSIMNRDFDNNLTGFHAQLFWNKEEKYVLGFAGTTWWSLPDLSTDFVEQLIPTKQDENALWLAKAVVESLGAGADITFVGHSLGGELASLAALGTGKRASTFNAAGLSPITESLFDFNTEMSKSMISAYRTTNDFVSNAQDKFLTPEAVGERIIIPGDGGHWMADVIDDLEQLNK